MLLLLLVLPAFFVFGQKRVDSRETTVSPEQEKKLQKFVKKFKTAEIDLVQFRKDISSLRETRILWDIDDTLKLDMVLYPHDVRSASFEASIVSETGTQKVELPEILTYKGYLPDGNSVRLTIDDDFIYGKIQTENGDIKIDQLRYAIKDNTVAANKLVIYNTSDMKEGDGFCGTPDVKIEELSQESNFTNSTSAGCKIVEVALDCDTEYWNDYNDGSFARMLGEVNMIQELYEDDLDAVLSVTRTHVVIGSAYTSTNGSTILSEINNLWSSSPWSGYTRDVVHHFTGKDTGPFGQASGIGVACGSSNPRAWSEDRANVDQTMAHEIGHILSGIHSDGTNCGTPNVRSIMCQGDNKQYVFSPASITRLTNFMNNNGQCYNFNTTSISGSDNMCVNNTRTYTLANFDGTAGTNITWSTNSRLTILSGQGTESVVVRGTSNGNGVLTVVLNYPGACGNVTETKSILVGPPFMTISLIGPDSSGWVTATANGGSSPYTWTLNNTTTWTTTSATTNRYVGCSGGYLYVQASNNCGQGSGSTFIPPCSGGGYYLTVHPNPADSEITVEKNSEHESFRSSEASFENPVTLTLYDFGASIVKSETYKESSAQLRLDISDLKKGYYFLKVTGKGIDETHQVIIE